jgi:hypothetical protein
MSDNITRTPARSTPLEITLHAKKASEREQDSANQTKQMRKKGLLDLFGDSP